MSEMARALFNWSDMVIIISLGFKPGNSVSPSMEFEKGIIYYVPTLILHYLHIIVRIRGAFGGMMAARVA